jgi:hypothetical protein
MYASDRERQTSLYCTVLYCTCFHSGSHRQVGAIHLDKVFMATRDATCIAPGFGTGNGREKMEKRVKRDFGQERGKWDGIWGHFPIVPSTSRFSSNQCRCSKGNPTLSTDAILLYLCRFNACKQANIWLLLATKKKADNVVPATIDINFTCYSTRQSPAL